MPNVPIRPQLNPAGPFTPDSLFNLPGIINDLNTSPLAVTATSGNVPINLNGAPQVELYNAGSFDCAVCFGNDSTVTATFPVGNNGGNYIIGAGQCKVCTIPPPMQVNFPKMWVAAICSGTNTTTLYASPGVGAS